MRSVRDVYVPLGSSVLDVGSAAKQSASYGRLFPAPDYKYVGLDISEGPNVSIVVHDAYDWTELEDDAFDAAISGQVFEHNPYFWLTAAEMARVVKPGGIITIIAPSTGSVHRHPLDCWRFYPDAWLALTSYVGLELVESYVEQPNPRKRVDGVEWRDSAMVARKPQFATEAERAAFHARLDLIRSTAVAFPVVNEANAPGRAFRDYESRHLLPENVARRMRFEATGRRLLRIPRNACRRLRRRDAQPTPNTAGVPD